MDNTILANKELYIKTYGCQMNAYDSERMKELFTPFGYNIKSDYSNADLVILNTCHIREKAAEKIYSELGKIRIKKEELKLAGKKMIVAVAGCVAQAEGSQIIKRAPFVDIVVGPQSYHNLPHMVKKINNQEKIDKVNLDFTEEEKFDLLPQNRVNKNISAFLSVQEGCDKFCTYCVVPYTRGAEFSRPVDKIIDEAKKLVDSGALEIMLLGQNVNAYHGVDQNGDNINLGQLIKKLDKIEGLKRIRYTTSHPSDMHDDLYEAHATCKKLMPYLHLPVQSGSDSILKAMNRKHSSAEYIKIIEKLRIARPDLAFSSDFIVGFPGETEEDFEKTLEVVKTIKYSGCYSFKFSERPGTPAELYDNKVAEDVKAERLKRLQNLLNEQQYSFNKSMQNLELEVLFERKQGDKIMGRSPYLQAVFIEGGDINLIGQIKKVKITKSTPHSLTGELL